MNRADLAARVGELAKLDRKQSDEAVKAVFQAIEESLAQGEKVTIVGFGAFGVKERAAHEGRNPATGDTVWVEASKTVTFKPGKTLKEKMD